MIPGGPEILIIVAVVVLLFGAKRIPELARSLGGGVRQFREGVSGENEKVEEEEKVEELAASEDPGTVQGASIAENRKD